MTDLERKADLAEALVPVAVRLAGSVRDDGPAEVAMILAGVPAAHLPALAVVLAAMVDPDRTPSELIGWVDQPLSVTSTDRARNVPIRTVREHGTPTGYEQHKRLRDMPACGPCLASRGPEYAARRTTA